MKWIILVLLLSGCEVVFEEDKPKFQVGDCVAVYTFKQEADLETWEIPTRPKYVAKIEEVGKKQYRMNKWMFRDGVSLIDAERISWLDLYVTKVFTNCNDAIQQLQSRNEWLHSR